MAVNPINKILNNMQTILRKNNRLLIGTVIIVAIMGSVIAITDNIKQQEARIAKATAIKKEKERLRLAADPITTENIYNKFNKARTQSSTPTLVSAQNLTAAAEQLCLDMITSNYFDYKNPTSGKDANSFITDNASNLHYNWYVSSIYSASNNQTATEVIEDAFKNQNENLTDTKYNSIGFAICQPKNDVTSKYIVAMLADIAGSSASASGANQSGSYSPNNTSYAPYVDNHDYSIPLNAGGNYPAYVPPPASSSNPETTNPTPPRKTYEEAANYCSGRGVPYNSSAWQQCISAYLSQ